ncbi:hypothetical protein SAY86_016911 [Trapa natans]|uniref:Uncharacterized protein n=1 Tax=Trapa natans TaxID=22666 RepID=A0AAN7M0M2_TRANT|nr:hypothetical protein SAY86_016911 [Trapa natans]
MMAEPLSSTASLLLVVVVLLLLLSPRPAASLSAYEALKQFNFPVGLLPKGVTGYELDRDTGKFRAFLNGSCDFSLEGSYQLKYKSAIGGYISENRMTGLSGVSVKVLFLWLNIVEVTRVDDELEFSVGIASASFEIDNFYESPQCGCGFDCLNKVRLRHSSSFSSN